MRHGQNETGLLKYKFTYVERVEPEFVPFRVYAFKE
jgi:hypothetical protein